MTKYKTYLEKTEDFLTYEAPALLVVDMQAGFFAPPERRDEQTKEMIRGCAGLIRGFRQAGWPVIYSRFESTEHCKNLNQRFFPKYRDLPDGGERLCFADNPSFEVLEELRPLKEELVFNKLGYDCFHGTCLDYCLRTQGRKTLVIAGVLTDECVFCTASGAFHLEYEVIVPSDCTKTYTEERKSVFLSTLDEAFGNVLSSQDTLAALSEKNRS